MTNPDLAFVLQRQSTATHIRKLVREIQDVVIDAWLTPQAQQLLNKHDHLRTRVQVALAPTLFRNLSECDGHAALQNLTTWLVRHHVEHTIGYRTSPQRDLSFHSVQIAITGHRAGVAPCVDVEMPHGQSIRKLHIATEFTGRPQS